MPDRYQWNDRPSATPSSRMTSSDPFWRAAALALVWCLVGFGIDPGPDGGSAPVQPAANAQRVAWVPSQFAADQRPDEGPRCPQ